MYAAKWPAHSYPMATTLFPNGHSVDATWVYCGNTMLGNATGQLSLSMAHRAYGLRPKAPSLGLAIKGLAQGLGPKA